MSEIKVNSIKGVGASTAAITVNNTNGTCTANVTNNLSNRRMNINGGMAVWQRATSVAVSDGTNEEVQACDRYGFKFGNASAGGATVSRSTDVPTNLGFPYSFKIDVTTVNNNSVANTQINFFHRFEAQDIVNSGWKYNDPNSFLTISFYFKSNKSGTNKLPIAIETQDGTQYWYVSEITQSNTNWNRYTVKVAGNSNLTFNSDNGYGMEIAWFLAAGSTYHGTADTWGTTKIQGTSNSTNYMDSTSNELFFTGIQIEATTNGIATDFEHRSYAQEYDLCRRYYEKWEGAQFNPFITGMAYQSTIGIADFHWYPKRDVPSLEYSNLSHFDRLKSASSSVSSAITNLTLTNTGPKFNYGNLYWNHDSMTGGNAILFRTNSNSAYLAISSEL